MIEAEEDISVRLAEEDRSFRIEANSSEHLSCRSGFRLDGKSKRGFCCLISLIILLAVTYFGAAHVMAGMTIARFVDIDSKKVLLYCGEEGITMANYTLSVAWPGCGVVNQIADFDTQCTGGCIKSSTMEEMHVLNNQYGGQLVSYNSRPARGFETVRLTGWWLPAPDHSPHTPRIVLQHGFESNSNRATQMFAAYQLRKLGFSVLVNNLRDHGYSDHSKDRVIEWGHAYPYDTLGAWDYAVSDPDFVMGGRLPDSQVGIMGFSMGAFTALNSFGLERRVPAVWVDSPPFTPSTGYALGFHKKLHALGLSVIGPLFVDFVWSKVKAAALARGVDLEMHSPETELPKGPDTKRPINWVGNIGDDMVPFADGAKLAALVKKYPQKYTFSTWETQGRCNGEGHCRDHMRDPAMYEERLCSFWTGAFDLKDSTRGCLDRLPIDANQGMTSWSQPLLV